MLCRSCPRYYPALWVDGYMIRAVVVDDQPMWATIIKDLLEATGKVEVVGQAFNGTDCLELVEKTTPDVLFLDVQMPDISGIEVAEIVVTLDHPPLIVFVTAHDEYAVKAFELATLDYVVKSDKLEVLQDRIAATIERIERALDEKAPALEVLREMVAQLVGLQPSAPLYMLPIKDYEEATVRLIDSSLIIYAAREGGRTVLHTAEKAFPTYYTIKRLEQRLTSQGFKRINRGVLINLKYVEHLIPVGDGSYDVILKDGSAGMMFNDLTVSRSRAKQLFTLLGI